ncbi:MAG: DUF2284 domain-containing protein [Promethearchaeota archaeon]
MPFIEIKYKDLIFDKKVQTMCVSDKFKCPNYGHSWACPPEAPFMRDKLQHYDKFYLIYHEFDLKDHVDKIKREKPNWTEEKIISYFYRKEIMRDLMEEEIFKFINNIESNNDNVFILWDGHCRLCEKEGKKCTYDEGQPCRYPDKIRYSMEAVGINVIETVRKLSFKIEWPPKKYVYRFGVVCLKL